jgi:chemotaxis signal transduction protein
MTIATDDLSEFLEKIEVLQHQLTELRKRIYRDIRSAELPQGHADLLSFRVGTSLVALPLPCVQTVVQRCALTPVPEAPRWVAGLLDLRGEMLPVLDLYTRLYGEPQEPALSDALVVCNDTRRRAAFVAQVVDAVHLGVTLDGDDDLHEVPHGSYVMAVAHLPAGTAVVLSVARLMAAVELPEKEAA